MTLTPLTFLIVCPMVFLAGFVDSIGGGGGLISLPAYLFAGLPVHLAIGTNKLSAAAGSTVVTARFARKGMINYKLALPGVIMAVLGSAVGAQISLSLDERILRYMLIVVLPVAAFFVLNKQMFHDRAESEEVTTKTYVIAAVAALVIGIYDGAYGPGTGTFLIIAFTVFAKMDLNHANGLAKAINVTTNITSLAVFLMNGQILLPLGLTAAVCNMAGGYLGAGMAMKNGSKIVRPIILTVLVLLAIRVLTEL